MSASLKANRRKTRASTRKSRNGSVCIVPAVLVELTRFQTIAEFKEGKYNILVSTSIGEEGLDIGEVDFVVIYDMPKQSIKLVSGNIPYARLV